MKLIIDIPDHIYEMVINTDTFGCYRFDTRKAIKKGTPLPKGHGRLIDADSIHKIIRSIEQSDTKWGMTAETAKQLIYDAFNSIPTIIEADKEQTE